MHPFIGGGGGRGGSASSRNGTPRLVRGLSFVQNYAPTLPPPTDTTPSTQVSSDMVCTRIEHQTNSPLTPYLPIPVGGVDRMAAVAQPRVRRHVLERLEDLNASRQTTMYACEREYPCHARQADVTGWWPTTETKTNVAPGRCARPLARIITEISTVRAQEKRPTPTTPYRPCLALTRSRALSLSVGERRGLSTKRPPWLSA